MPGTAAGASYSPVSVTQFSVFLENRVGKLLELVQSFDDAMCRICALTVLDSSDHAVIRLVANDVKVTRRILVKQALPFMETPILVVALDAQHTLGRMCQFLLGAEISVRFCYPLMGCERNGQPTVALAVDDLTLAGQILMRKEFRLLAESELPRFGE
jgi:hypothetical protein